MLAIVIPRVSFQIYEVVRDLRINICMKDKSDHSDVMRFVIFRFLLSDGITAWLFKYLFIAIAANIPIFCIFIFLIYPIAFQSIVEYGIPHENMIFPVERTLDE